MGRHTKIIGAPLFTLGLALAGCVVVEAGQDGQDGQDEPEDAETSTETTEEDTDDSGLTSALMTEETTDTGLADCEIQDHWEPNPSAEEPSMMTWDSADDWVAHRQIDELGLCEAEDDWYHFDVASLGYTEHYLYIRALIKDAGLCGADCGSPVIPAGPRHAMTIEVYRADTMQLLTSRTDDDGVMSINGPGGDDYAHQLLIHVFSPTLDAAYPYRLSVQVRNYDGEDECEC